MKVGYGLKITLLIISILILGIGLYSLYTILVIENKNFEYSMLNLFGVILAGLLSIIYHVKTLSYYKIKLTVIVLEKNIFWIGNIVFALMLIGYSLYILYIIYDLYENINSSSNLLTPILICIFTLISGVFLITEVGFLYLKTEYFEQHNRTESIDDIKGIAENNIED